MRFNFLKKILKVQDLRYVIAFRILQSEVIWNSYKARNIAKDCVSTLFWVVFFLFFPFSFFHDFPEPREKMSKEHL